MSGIVLLAMAPSGETFFARDSSERVWLIQPEGAGPPRTVDDRLVQRAVADHGFERVEREFSTWPELDDFRQALATRVTPDQIIDRDAFDLEDLRLLIDVAQRWVAEGEGRRARRLALELLRVPAIVADLETHEWLVSFIESLDEPRAGLRSVPSTSRQSAARARWQALDDAA